MKTYLYRGKERDVKEISKMCGVGYTTLKNRLEKGMSIEKATDYRCGTRAEIPYDIYKDGKFVCQVTNQSEVAKIVGCSTSYVNIKLALCIDAEIWGYEVKCVEYTQLQEEFAEKWDAVCDKLKRSGKDLSRIHLKKAGRGAEDDYISD